MEFFKKLREHLCRALEWAVMVTMALLVVVVMIQILARVFQIDCGWTEETATFLLIWAGLLGASVGFSRKAHLGIDYLVSKTDADSQKLIGVMSQLIVIFFAAYAMVWGGGKVVADTLLREQLSTALKIPMGYVYLALPISGAFIVLFALEQLLEVISGKESETEIKEEV